VALACTSLTICMSASCRERALEQRAGTSAVDLVRALEDAVDARVALARSMGSPRCSRPRRRSAASRRRRVQHLAPETLIIDASMRVSVASSCFCCTWGRRIDGSSARQQARRAERHRLRDVDLRRDVADFFRIRSNSEIDLPNCCGRARTSRHF